MAEERLQRRLAAILAADVADYSRLMDSDEAGTRQRFRSLLQEVIQPKIAERDGCPVKSMGDGLLVAFPSVVDALACATEVQDAMATRNADEPRAAELRNTKQIGRARL